MRELSAVLAIANRDFVKLIRDRGRIVADLAFPLILVALLGPALQASFGEMADIDLRAFVFTGVLAQTVWQSAAIGVISLIADREEDFSQEIFVSPISRYSIIAGKILGESLVALPQAAAILVLGALLGIALGPATAVALVVVVGFIAIFGAAFGILILSSISSQRTANQVFPFIMLPQFFLAGVFNPLHGLPWYLDLLSRVSPLRYAVDLGRNVYDAFEPAARPTHIASAAENLAVMGGMLLVFVLVGTARFVRAERNR